jgi:putative transposase
LGWVPFKGRDLHREGNAFRFAGNTFRVFYSCPLPEGKIKHGTLLEKSGHFVRRRKDSGALFLPRRVKAIQARTARRRLDFLPKRSAEIVRIFDHIAVGNVNASGLAQTSLAKSVLDAPPSCCIFVLDITCTHCYSVMIEITRQGGTR